MRILEYVSEIKSIIKKEKKMGFLTDICPNCGQKVRKGASYCSNCGAAAPAGRAKCGRCGAEVSTGSKFCWSCGNDLRGDVKAAVVEGRWLRGADDFAARVEPADLKGLLTKGLIIESGTKALLFQRGKYRGTLEPGKHNIGGFLHRLNNFDLTTPTSVVLVDTSDVELRILVEKLYSSDSLPVSAECSIILNLKEPERFFNNIFKGRSSLKVVDLEELLKREVRNVLIGVFQQYKVGELPGDLELRASIEERLRTSLDTTLNRNGFSLVQLRFIDFNSEYLEEVRRVDLIEARINLRKRLDELITSDKMRKFKDEKEFEDFIRQTEHEMGMKELIREDEIERLKRSFRDREIDHEMAREHIIAKLKLEQALERQPLKAKLERLELEHKLENEKLAKIHIRLDQIEDAKTRAKIQLIEEQTKAEISQIELEVDKAEMEFALDMKRSMQELKLEKMRQIAEIESETLQKRSQVTLEALLSMAEGLQAEKILEIIKLREKEKMTPEQILADVAPASPEIAKALGEKFRAQELLSDERYRDLQKYLSEQKDASKEQADRLERIFRESILRISEVAEAKVSPRKGEKTIITGGGAGAPVIIGEGEEVKGKKVVICKECKAENEPQARFCAECGAPLK